MISWTPSSVCGTRAAGLVAREVELEDREPLLESMATARAAVSPFRAAA